MSQEKVLRDVVSYVRRGDRLNNTQQKAWDSWRERFVIELPAAARKTSIAPDARVDFAKEFGRDAPLLVEVGTGNGVAIAALAKAHPDANVLGFEVFIPAVASTLSRLRREEISNVRMINADAEQGFETLFDEQPITELWTFFPDPWHKKKHRKRRIVNPRFAHSAATHLVLGGRWRLATDWEDYAQWIRDVLAEEPLLREEFSKEAPRWELRPITRFEQRAIDAGREVVDLSYVRVAAKGAEEIPGQAWNDVGIRSEIGGQGDCAPSGVNACNGTEKAADDQA
ncbi:MAG: tRNA (guanosine(46)-N7)-methyltransferase TrmB [Propionibacteriaceae bacterium]|jgi:tRNA (guanine-N7-)-methyltransferase|nr:tRNA (guanosine(46)-N7)-methyltransferase TrmB [Propionibacteriaceae bacterium]